MSQMPKTPIQEKKEKQKQIEKQKRSIAGFVGEMVLSKLGKPKLFSHVDAPCVGENRFRVNVWCFNNKASMAKHIAHSYYVKATADGIINSLPEIKKEYD